jgi:hypothetical protein
MAQDATVIKIKPRTKHAPFVADEIRRVALHAKNNIAYTDTGTVNLFELPGNVLVKEANVRVTTAFDASGTSAAATLTITMPNDTGTETLFDAANTLLQSTGFKPSTTMAVTPSSGGYLTLNYTANTTTAGALEVYLSYVEFANAL